MYHESVQNVPMYCAYRSTITRTPYPVPHDLRLRVSSTREYLLFCPDCPGNFPAVCVYAAFRASTHSLYGVHLRAERPRALDNSQPAAIPSLAKLRSLLPAMARELVARPPELLALGLALGLALATCAAAQCTGTKAYAFTVDMKWTADVDTRFPSNAEITKVVAVAHAKDHAPWDEGGLASDGLVGLVRDGSVDAFEKLLKGHKEEGHVSDYEFAGKDRNSPDSTLEFELTLDGDKNATFVTVLAGIRPSPGWFVGRGKFPLCDGVKREFLETNDQDPELFGYNSGLSEGDVYTDAFKLKEKKTDIASMRAGFAYGSMQTKREKSAKGENGSSQARLFIGGAIGAGVLLVAVCVAAVLLLRWRSKRAATMLVPADVVEEGGGEVDW